MESQPQILNSGLILKTFTHDNGTSIVRIEDLTTKQLLVVLNRKRKMIKI